MLSSLSFISMIYSTIFIMLLIIDVLHSFLLHSLVTNSYWIAIFQAFLNWLNQSSKGIYCISNHPHEHTTNDSDLFKGDSSCFSAHFMFFKGMGNLKTSIAILVFKCEDHANYEWEESAELTIEGSLTSDITLYQMIFIIIIFILVDIIYYNN